MSLRKPHLLETVFGLTVFSLYLATLSPSIRFWDSAELTAAAATLGIPHPPGAPLYVLLGRYFTILTFLPAPIAVNLLSAFCAALSAVLTIYIFRYASNKSGAGGAYFAAAIMAWGGLLWIQAVRAEVYAPALLFLEIALLAALRFRRTSEIRFALIAAYAWVLAGGIHPVIAMSGLLPILVIAAEKGNLLKLDRKSLFLFLPVCLIALSIYLYLPLRGAQNPPLKWGAPETISGFLEMVTAREFAFSVSLGSLTELQTRFSTFWRSISGNFPLPIMLFVVAGLLRRLRFWQILLFSGGLAAVFLRQGLPHPDYAGYVLPAALALALWAGDGFEGLLQGIGKIFTVSRNFTFILGLIVFLILIVPLFLVQFPRNNLYGNRWAEKLGRDILQPLPDSSLVLFDDVSSYFICQYLQTVESLRCDCALIQPYALDADSRSRKWYSAQLQSQGGIAGLNNLPASEYEIVGRLIEANSPVKPLFCEYGDAFRPFRNYLAPQGILYRIVIRGSLPPHQPYDYPPPDSFKFDCEASLAFAERIFARGLFYYDIGDSTAASDFFRKAASYQKTEPTSISPPVH